LSIGCRAQLPQIASLIAIRKTSRSLQTSQGRINKSRSERSFKVAKSILQVVAAAGQIKRLFQIEKRISVGREAP
jgi:hypothetical protein